MRTKKYFNFCEVIVALVVLKIRFRNIKLVRRAEPKAIHLFFDLSRGCSRCTHQFIDKYYMFERSTCWMWCWIDPHIAINVIHCGAMSIMLIIIVWTLNCDGIEESRDNNRGLDVILSLVGCWNCFIWFYTRMWSICTTNSWIHT